MTQWLLLLNDNEVFWITFLIMLLSKSVCNLNIKMLLNIFTIFKLNIIDRNWYYRNTIRKAVYKTHSLLFKLYYIQNDNTTVFKLQIRAQIWKCHFHSKCFLLSFTSGLVKSQLLTFIYCKMFDISKWCKCVKLWK